MNESEIDWQQVVFQVIKLKMLELSTIDTVTEYFFLALDGFITRGILTTNLINLRGKLLVYAARLATEII